jgi:two-component system sensor histidine kinase YesM
VVIDMSKKIISMLSYCKGSIKKTIQLSYLLIIVIMIIPTVYSVSVSIMHSNQYDHIITNVSRANHLNQIVKADITDEVWDIVAGKKEFKDGKQYETLRSIRNGVSEMMDSTSNKQNRQLLDVVSRAEKTLEMYVDRLGDQTSNNASVDATEDTLDEIRGVSALMSNILQDFIVAEIETASETNDSIKKSSVTLTVIQFVIALFVIGIAGYGFTSISENIRKPIYDMRMLSSRIAEGDLSARVVLPNVEELDPLADNLNAMAGKINGLINENIQEQKNLQKAEMKALQAQITPHFLYNTLDTIIWLAEADQTEDVIKVTRAFSDFLRISLSKGHEWISVNQELDHVKNYLTIQKVRYADILNYKVESDEVLGEFQMLKLVLQPLVENAIYHGIKNKRGRGHIKVTAKYVQNEGTVVNEPESVQQGKIYFAVEDDGIGFEEEKLQKVIAEIHGTGGAELLSTTYGLYNVNKRLCLYYNNETDGLHITSEYGKGTCVSFTIPCKIKQGEDNV